MSKLGRHPTSRPWRVADTRTDDNALQIPIVDDYGCIAWLVNRKRPDLFGSDVANAAHIVKCVNMHEELAYTLMKLRDEIAYHYPQVKLHPELWAEVADILAKAGQP